MLISADCSTGARVSAGVLVAVLPELLPPPPPPTRAAAASKAPVAAAPVGAAPNHSAEAQLAFWVSGLSSLDSTEPVPVAGLAASAGAGALTGAGAGAPPLA